MAEELDCPRCDEPMDHRTSLVGDEHYDCKEDDCEGFFFIEVNKDNSDDR